MINHQHKCIYIHIPKTGGSSIEKKLGLFDTLAYGVQDHRNIREIRPRKSVENIPLLFSKNAHFSRKKFLKAPLSAFRNPEKELTKEQFDSYFKFTFVRNPWDRLYSWYKHVMRTEQHKRDMKLPDDCSFKKFMIEYRNVNYGFFSQLYWLQDYDGSLPFDFIGRFESLENDFKQVAETIGLERPDLPNLLISGNRPYTEAYNKELIDFVSEHFQEEITLFGYSFGE